MANEPLQYGRYYHIYNRGNNGENLFMQQRNYPYFLQLYAKHIQPVAETFAYCLLPNHFHFGLRTYTQEDITNRLVHSPRMNQSWPRRMNQSWGNQSSS